MKKVSCNYSSFGKHAEVGYLTEPNCPCPARTVRQGSVRDYQAPSVATGYFLANSAHCFGPGFAPPFTRLSLSSKMSSNVQILAGSTIQALNCFR